MEEETVWLTQKLMPSLFDMDVRTVSEHLGSLFASGEQTEDSVIRKFRTTAVDGKNYQTQFYNEKPALSMPGYRGQDHRMPFNSNNPACGSGSALARRSESARGSHRGDRQKSKGAANDERRTSNDERRKAD